MSTIRVYGKVRKRARRGEAEDLLGERKRGGGRKREDGEDEEASGPEEETRLS